MDTEFRQIKWTQNAVIDYNKIIIYLTDNWPEKVVTNFEATVINKLENLSRFPEMGNESKKFYGVRSLLLTKHNRLYYRLKERNIEILNILDTRQNPNKNPY